MTQTGSSSFFMNTLIIISSKNQPSYTCGQDLFRLVEGKVDTCYLDENPKFNRLFHLSVASFCKANASYLCENRLGIFINIVSFEKYPKKFKVSFHMKY